MSGLDDVRASQDRDFGAEGIPMYVVLVDETLDETGADAPATRPDPSLADALTRLRADVAPSRRGDDLGVTATLLAAAAYADHPKRRPG